MKKKGVGRPRDGNPEETRREILKAAESSFAASGYVGATTRQVASLAGVNVATLHYHFGNKEGLYRAVLAEVCRGELPSAPENGTARARVERAIGATFDFAAARPSLPRLALLDRLAGPAGPRDESVDPRVPALEKALTDAGVGKNGSANGLTPAKAARWIVGLVDVSLSAENGATRHESPTNGTAPEEAGAPPRPAEAASAPYGSPAPPPHARERVIAAALRITGLD